MTPLTQKQAQHAKRWLQKRLGITDWKVKLSLCDDLPPWAPGCSKDACGCCLPDVAYKKAQLWVSNAHSIANKETPISTLCHEVLHIAMFDTGGEGEPSNHVEYLINQLSYICESAYRAEFPECV